MTRKPPPPLEAFQAPIGLDMDSEVIDAPHMSINLAFFASFERVPSGREMSNFDHVVPDGLEDELRSGKYIAGHSALHFHGDVFWDGKQFVEYVNRFWYHVDTKQAPTLEELMRTVNEKWGAE